MSAVADSLMEDHIPLALPGQYSGCQ